MPWPAPVVMLITASRALVDLAAGTARTPRGRGSAGRSRDRARAGGGSPRPPREAAIALSAICAGVIGRCGVIDGTWIAPVTAQLTMTRSRGPGTGRTISRRSTGRSRAASGAAGGERAATPGAELSGATLPEAPLAWPFDELRVAPMIEKLLVANRGEIAVRAFRAANELGVRSVAVYAPEDRDSVHRLKADESYEIGVPGRPVSTYLDAELIVGDGGARSAPTASIRGTGSWRRARVLADACAQAGVRVRRAAGRGAGARGRQDARARGGGGGGRGGARAARARSRTSRRRWRRPADVGFPLFVKAAMGGGGRGMRLVRDAGRARGGAGGRGARGGGGVRRRHGVSGAAMVPARHIEVQLLADAAGRDRSSVRA